MTNFEHIIATEKDNIIYEMARRRVLGNYLSKLTDDWLGEYYECSDGSMYDLEYAAIDHEVEWLKGEYVDD